MKKVMKHHFTIGVLTGAMMISLIAPGKSFAQTLKPIIKADVYEIDDQGENGYINVIPATETDVVEKSGLRRSAEARFVPDDLYTTYPQIRNQGSFGTCWAHSTAALGEFSAYKKYDKLFNTSEMHIVYYTYNTVEKSKYGNTVGDTTSLATTNTDEDNIYQYGGNIDYSSNALLNWKGYASEEDFPYFEDVYDKELALTYSKTDYTDANAYKDYLRVVGVYEVNLKDDPDYAKELIKTYGAISASFCADYDDGYWEDNNCYYASRIRKTNHSISIVGWDDNFSKENFYVDLCGKTPSKDGAWLVRNSWGGQPYASGNARYEDFNGYFWLSYEEGSLNVSAVNGGKATSYSSSFAFDVVDASDTTDGRVFDNNYYYDGNVSNAYFSVNGDWKGANVFTAEASETLEAVGIYFYSGNVDYTIDVYKLNVSASSPTDGTKLTTITGKTEAKGFYTIMLDKAQNLETGDKFSIVVSMKANKAILTEASGGLTKGFSAATPEGSSWVYMNKEWVDCNTYGWNNFRIKAYTNDSTTISHNITYKLDGGTNSSSNPGKYAEGKGVEEFAAPTKTGYEFLGWYVEGDNSTYISAIPSTATSDYVLCADWKIINYEISYVLGGGTNNLENPDTYTIEDEITLKDPTRENYTFLRWENTSKETVSKIEKGTTGAIELTAVWKDNNHVHVYDQQVADPKYLKSPATYVSAAVYFYSCACEEHVHGEETFTYGEPLPKTDLSSCTVKLSADTYTYNGQAQTPGVTVYIGSKAVSRDACKVTYSSNINAGTAKVTVTACDGNYPVKGSTSKTFTILKAKNAITLPKKEITKTYSTKTQTVKLSASATAGTITYASNNKKVKVDGNGKVTIPKKFIGTVTITLTSAKENYETSTLKATISVVPTTPSISKVKSAKSGNLTVTWKKVTDVTGVEIQYSTDKNFGKKGLKSVTVKGTKTTTKSISKLTGKKKYYVRIRTYKTVSGKKLYSAWSKVKNIKIKK